MSKSSGDNPYNMDNTWGRACACATVCAYTRVIGSREIQILADKSGISEFKTLYLNPKSTL